MKRILAIVAAIGLLAFGAMAYAHGEGGPGPGYGPGDGRGQGCGGCGGCGGDEDRPAQIDPEKRAAFFKESRDIRKKIHDKMFELREAELEGDQKKIEAIKGEIEKLQGDITKIAEKHGIKPGKDGSHGKHGGHMGPGSGPRMMGPNGPGH